MVFHVCTISAFNHTKTYSANNKIMPFENERGENNNDALNKTSKKRVHIFDKKFKSITTENINY